MQTIVKEVKVDIHHLARVEGHGNIFVRVRDGAVQEARWQVVETPRYFEVMLKGKHYSSAGILVARICGICSVGHTLASVRATEDAFGVEVPPLARKLRLLAKHGETIGSHVLHLFFLAAPDFLGLPSAIPLMSAEPELFALSARLKAVGNRLCDVVAGRATHPVTLQVGGVARRPKAELLRPLRDQLLKSLADLKTTAELFATFDIPDFTRETEFVSLKGEGDYSWIGGRLHSTDGVDRAESDYLAMTNEYVVESSTSKWCKLSRESFAVGALARFNNNHAHLTDEAAAIARELGLQPVCHNPFMNNVAQLVEVVDVTQRSITLIDDVLAAASDEPTMAEVTPRAGTGTSAIEVPRGILYHQYDYDAEGRVVRADCVIPTTQNNANIHHDIRALATDFAARGKADDDLEKLCSMLVRSYDPCISCSVH